MPWSDGSGTAGALVSMDMAAGSLADLEQARPLLDRKSTAERVTDILRDMITTSAPAARASR